MKKNRKRWYPEEGIPGKFLRKMKLILFLCWAGMMQVSAMSYAQTGTVSIRVKETALHEIFQLIEAQCGYTFVYNNEQLNGLKPVSIEMTDAKISKVLDECLKGTDLRYELLDQIIVINRRSALPQTALDLQGTVKDKEGNPLPGVSVFIKGTTIGVATDVDGKFKMQLPEMENMVLVFSFTGMKKQEVKYTKQPVLNIVMEEDVAEMEEVVVTGYQNIKKENATGSYQTITSKELERRYSTDIISSLEGMLSGLVSYNKGLNDDAESNIMIRGVSTFTDRTKPLVVVDGLPIEGSIETINPYDISSITVLKDASAASIYGVRASNGVIVVTTKRAQNDRVEVNFNMDITINEKQQYDNYGWANAAQTIELEEKSYAATMQDPMYSQYIPMYVNMYPSSINPILSMLVQRDAGTLTADEYNRQIERLKKNDYLKEWSDAVLRNQVLQQYNMAFRAKGNRLTSSINLNFKRSNQGIVNEHNNILNFSYRGDIYAAKWLDVAVGFNANMVRSKKHIDNLHICCKHRCLQSFQCHRLPCSCRTTY